MISFSFLPPLGLSAEVKFNFDEVKIGVAEYSLAQGGPTGTTVIYFPSGATGAIDTRGGAAAVREASSIDELNTWAWVDAIVFAGGSTYGLEAASGVAAEILKIRKNSTHFNDIPSVPSAIVYDFSGRKGHQYPDKKLGQNAFNNLKVGQINTGKSGAGVNTTVGKFLGGDFSQSAGQGAAFYESHGIKILAITVVNAMGNITDGKGNILRGSFDKKLNRHLDIETETLKKWNSKETNSNEEKGNTTITAIITNVKLERHELKRLAVASHTSMARYIQPFHTQSDGDTLFALTTNTFEKPKDFSLTGLGIVVSKVLGDAVLKSF
jgi:L-aminopeptidase/D-esterase-like protein